MATKRNNQYKIQMEEIALKDGSSSGKRLSFEFENHDDLFAILESGKIDHHFVSEADRTEFLIGLKLFSEVMLRDKNNPLFDDFRPAFLEFMKKLKGK